MMIYQVNEQLNYSLSSQLKGVIRLSSRTAAFQRVLIGSKLCIDNRILPIAITDINCSLLQSIAIYCNLLPDMPAMPVLSSTAAH